MEPRERDLSAELGLVDRIPPQDLESEQGVLGSCLVSREAAERVSELLAPEDFYQKAHQDIYRAILRAQRGDYAPDLLGVTSILREQELLDACGGYGYVMDLASGVPHAAHAEYYAKIVRKKASQRELITLGARMVERGFAQDLDDPLDWAAGEATKLADRRTGAEYHKIGDVARRVVAEMEAARQAYWAGDAAPNRILSGFPSLDDLTGGFAPGQMVTLAARPSVGKSALAMGIAANVARSGKPVLAFSAEMTSDELVSRILSGLSGADGRSVMSGSISDEMAESFREAAEMVDSLPFAIHDESNISLRIIERKSRRFRAEHGEIGLIVIDYLQLLGETAEEYDRKRASANRNEEISRLSRGIKNLAKALKCPILALSQLSREVEKRQGGGEPQLSDLRESGSIEQDSNTVIFLWGPLETDEAGWRDVRSKVAKNRGGKLGRFNLRFFGPTTTFHDPLLQPVWHGGEVVPRYQAQAAAHQDDTPSPEQAGLFDDQPPGGVQVMLEIGEDDEA
ncbi:Replicative DNA helicase [compost metagenome]